MKGRSGFTLIEAVLTMTVLALGLTGVMTLYHRTVARYDEVEKWLIAEELARAKVEQIVFDKKFRGYDYIVSANYPASEDLSLSGFAGMTRAINIAEVDGIDLTTSRFGSGYKKVTIDVSVLGGPTVNLVTLVTQWGGP